MIDQVTVPSALAMRVPWVTRRQNRVSKVPAVESTAGLSATSTVRSPMTATEALTAVLLSRKTSQSRPSRWLPQVTSTMVTAGAPPGTVGGGVVGGAAVGGEVVCSGAVVTMSGAEVGTTVGSVSSGAAPSAPVLVVICASPVPPDVGGAAIVEAMVGEVVTIDVAVEVLVWRAGALTAGADPAVSTREVAPTESPARAHPASSRTPAATATETLRTFTAATLHEGRAVPVACCRRANTVSDHAGRPEPSPPGPSTRRPPPSRLPAPAGGHRRCGMLQR